MHNPTCFGSKYTVQLHLPGRWLRGSPICREFCNTNLTSNYRYQIKDSQWRTQEFCSEGVQQIQLRTEDRENGNLGAVAP